MSCISNVFCFTLYLKSFLFMRFNRDFILELEQLIDILDENPAGVQEFLQEYHASEIAKFIENLSPRKRNLLIQHIDVEMASEAISEMNPESRPEDLLASLLPERAAEIIEELSDDDATDLINELPEAAQNEILKNLDVEDAKDLRKLMSYAEDTAGGLMTTEIIKVNYLLTKKDALEEVIRLSEDAEEFYSVYAVDNVNKLAGYISLKNLIKARADVLIKDIMIEDVVSVYTYTDQEEVAKLMAQYNIPGIPVVDENMRLLGKVTFDDVMDVLREESTEDILKISGVSDDEELAGSWKEAVKSRLPWLLLNLLTAFLAGSVIRHFENTVMQLIVITSYMTVIAGMGGNAATQALAVTIRRISLNDITDKQAYSTVLKEFLVGLTNGAVIGVVVLISAFLFDANPMLGLVVFMAMTGNLIIAGITGSAIPLLLKRIGIDPAVASSIIITTFTDICGFVLLLGLATVILL